MVVCILNCDSMVQCMLLSHVIVNKQREHVLEVNMFSELLRGLLRRAIAYNLKVVVGGHRHIPQS